MIPMKTLKMNDDIFEITDGKAREALNFDKSATQGYILTATNSGKGTKWSPVGLPTDEQTAEAVSDWLDEHPEATTTVADGSVGKVKLGTTSIEYIESMKTGAEAAIDDKVYTISDITFYAEKMKSASFSYTDFRRTTKTLFTDTSSEVYKWLQSACYVDSLEHIILGFCKPPVDDSSEIEVGILVEYNVYSNTVVRRSSELSLGHMNDITYNPNTGKMYVATMNGGDYASKIAIVDPETLTIVDYEDVQDSISQISYDRRNEVYYTVGSGFTLKVYNEEFSALKTVVLQTPEDIGIYDKRGEPLTAQGSICINGDFWIIYQDYDDVYFFSYDLDTGDIYRYQNYPNMMYHEECECVALIDNTMYSFGAYYDNVFIRTYDIGTSSSNQPTLQNSGIEILAGTDLNTIKAPGKYFSPDVTRSEGLSNIPLGIASGFSLYVLQQAQDWVIQIIVETSEDYRIFSRKMNRSNVWQNWCASNPMSKGVLIPNSSNLNNYESFGKYYCVSAENAATLSNTPPYTYGGFDLYVVYVGASWKAQILFEKSTEIKIAYRVKTESGWSSWINGYHYLFQKGSKLGSNVNMNDYTNAGKFWVENSTVAATITNSPTTSAGYSLFVIPQGDSMIMQLAIEFSTTAFKRYYRAKSGSTWGSWITVSDS